MTDSCIEQYRDPDPQAAPLDYRSVKTCSDSAILEFVIAGKTLLIAVRALLP